MPKYLHRSDQIVERADDMRDKNLEKRHRPPPWRNLHAYPPTTTSEILLKPGAH